MANAIAADHAATHDHHSQRSLAASALVALGIVYGDIGTSPIYAFQVAMGAVGGNLPVHEAVLGVVGLIIYAILFTIAFKYICIVMRADNHGEGGILSLLGLVKSTKHARGIRIPGLVFIAVAGAALLYGDGALTPAISVLSAMEGIGIYAPHFSHWIVPATVAILVGLFASQRFGTGTIGKLFGPVMLVWFASIGLIGIAGIARHPEVLAAFDPRHAIRLLALSPAISFAVFGAVFLALTGGEALYADMGHVGAPAIRAAWFGLVLPALMLNYLGQGAAVLSDPAAASAPFWNAVPSFASLPMVAIAALATVIASQALISGVFSLTRQSMQMGLMPRMMIVQTSGDEHGQIYVPTVNWLLMAATISVVLAFRSSEALASAYGISVSGTMLITTILLYRVMAGTWKWNLWLAAGLTLVFAVVDACFLAANSAKLLEGGLLPVVLGAIVGFLMVSWHLGANAVKAELTRMAKPLDAFVSCADDGRLARVPGTAVWLTKVSSGITPTMQEHVTHVKALHENVILLTVEIARQPRVGDHDWLQVEDLGHGFHRVVMRSGFMQRPCAETAIRGLGLRGVIHPDRNDIHYFVGHEIPARKKEGSKLCFASWLAFALMSKLNGKAADYFRIPHERVMEVGIRVEI